MSKYCAVSCNTESGDSYVFCIPYVDLQDIADHIQGVLEDEFSFVYGVDVDSMVDWDTDNEIKNVIWERINK